MSLVLPAGGALLEVSGDEVIFGSLENFGSAGSEASVLSWLSSCISGP